MERLHRNTTVYWLLLAFAIAFSIFGLSIVVLGLSMSLTGGINGGLTLNMTMTCSMLLWAGMVGAFDIALWRLRNLPAELTIMALAWGQRPRERLAALAWWWTRAAWYSFISLLGLLLATAHWLFRPWVSAG